MKVVWAISIIVVLAVFSYNQNAFAIGGTISNQNSCTALGLTWLTPFHCFVNGELTINEGENFSRVNHDIVIILIILYRLSSII